MIESLIYSKSETIQLKIVPDKECVVYILFG